MILEWVLLAWLLKKLLDRFMLRTMTAEEYQSILKDSKWLSSI